MARGLRHGEKCVAHGLPNGLVGLTCKNCGKHKIASTEGQLSFVRLLKTIDQFKAEHESCQPIYKKKTHDRGTPRSPRARFII